MNTKCRQLNRVQRIARVCGVVAIMLVVSPRQAEATPDFDALLKACAVHREQDALDAIGRLAAIGAPLQGDETAALLRILHDAAGAGAVRVGCLELLLDRAGAAAIGAVLRESPSWLEKFEAGAVEQRPVNADELGLHDMVLAILGRAQSPECRLWSIDGESMLKLVKQGIRCTRGSEVGRRSRTALVRSPLNAIERTRVMIEYWKEYPYGGGGDSLVYAALEPSLMPDLNALIDTEGEPHWGAASAVAHLGLPGSVEAIARFQERVRKVAGDRVADTNCAELVAKARLQQDPEGLIGFLRTDAAGARQNLRCWAIRRSLEKGTSRDALRDALLAFKREVDSRKEEPPDAPKMVAPDGQLVPFGRRPWLGEIKRCAVEAGVLRPEDWPDVRYGPPPRS